MKLVANLMLTVALVAGLAGGAMAENNTKAKPNYKDFAAAWYYPYVTPAVGANTGEVGIPDKGTIWQKDFSGEVIYIEGSTPQHRGMAEALAETEGGTLVPAY